MLHFMGDLYQHYLENFPEEFSIRHKIAEHTEKKSFHLHRQVEVMYAVSDNLKCRTEHDNISIPSGSILLIDTMNLHYIYGEEGSGLCDRYVMYFSNGFISSLSTQEIDLMECFMADSSVYPMILHPQKSQQTSLRKLMDQMIESTAKQENADTPQTAFMGILNTKFLLGQFLLILNQVFFAEHGRRSSSENSHYAIISSINEFIRDNIQQEITMDLISKHFAVSKTQLYSIYKEVTGRTISEYITDYRISKAKDYLINSDYSIEAIGEKVGYMTISSFSRTFKNVAEISPLQYRKKYRNLR